jgi:hypothetical protein
MMTSTAKPDIPPSVNVPPGLFVRKMNRFPIRADRNFSAHGKKRETLHFRTAGTLENRTRLCNGNAFPFNDPFLLKMNQDHVTVVYVLLIFSLNIQNEVENDGKTKQNKRGQNRT